MADAHLTSESQSTVWDLNPRHSLAASAMWLIIALAVTFSIAAAVWVGSIARKNVLEQHLRRLSLETDQLSSDVGQAVAARLGAARAARSLLRSTDPSGQTSNLSDVFDELVSVYPELDWIAIADSRGIIVSSHGSFRTGSSVASTDWFTTGLKGPWPGHHRRRARGG